MNLAPTDPLAVRLTGAVRAGALGELALLLDEQPHLARARIVGRRGGWRTALHVATDWPGYFPNGPGSCGCLSRLVPTPARRVA